MSQSLPMPPAFRGRLARRILLTVLPFILIPVLLMGYAAYHRAQNLLIEQATQQIQAIAESTLDDLQAWLRIKQIRLQLALYRPDTQSALAKLLRTSRFDPDFPAQRENVLNALQQTNRNASLPLFNDFAVLDAQGMVLVSTRPELEGQNLSEAAWWPRLRPLFQGEEDAIHLGSSHLTPLLPDGVFGVLTATRGVAPDTRNAIVLGLSKGYPVERFLQTTPLPLAATKGYFITPEGEWVRLDPLKQELMTEALPEPLTQNLRVLFARPTLQQYTTLEYAWPEAHQPLLAVAGWLPAFQAGIGVEVSKTAILANITSLVPFTIILLTVTVLFLAVVIWLLTQSITRPIQIIAQAAASFADGDFRARAPVQRQDELGMLAYTFNQMADQLSEFTQTLEHQVEERTRQIQTAAEVAALATSATSLDEVLQRTVNLIVERFPQYYHASVFLLDEEGRYAVLRESTGPVGEEMKRRGHRLEVGGQSLVGWAAAHNQPRIASEVTEDPIHFKNPLLPETRSEAAIPIAVGPHVLGVLDVQSKNPYAFDEHAIATLQTLARQLAAAIYTTSLLEATRIDLAATQALYQASRRIAQAETEAQVFQHLKAAFQESETHAALFIQQEEEAHLEPLFTYPEHPVGPLSPKDLPTFLAAAEPVLLQRETLSRLPAALQRLLRSWRSDTAALLPVRRENRLVGFLLLAPPQNAPLSRQRLQPYINLAEVVSNTLTKLAALRHAELRLAELEALNRLSEAVSRATSLEALYPTLAQELRRLYGDVTVAVVEYNPTRQEFRVPYVWEQGATRPRAILDPVPLGEGITSLIIQKQRPLLINRQADLKRLGARHFGPEAKSLMGAPLIVGDEILGVLMVQDLEQEERFTQEDFRTFLTLSAQVALTMRNIRLLEQSQRRAEQQQRLLNLGERLRRTLDLPTLLETTARELRGALQARRVVMRFYGFPETSAPPPPQGNGSNGGKE